MFTGPSGDIGGTVRDRYQRILQLGQDYNNGYATGRPSSGGGGAVARIDTSLQEQDDAREGERARLLMTPGVSRGGSTAMRPSADSPLNVSSAHQFQRFGDTYTYDPSAAAEEAGSTEATKQNAADRTRYQALLKMPGLTPGQAARLVYGRGQPLDTEEKQHEMEGALADYVRNPSREGAAGAIEHGANPYVFNPGFGIAIGSAPRAPVRGSPEYLAAMKEEEAIRGERATREIELRDKLKEAGVKSRTYRYTGEDKRIHVIDLDTGKEISESPSVVRPTASDENAALRQALTPTRSGTLPVAPVVPPAKNPNGGDGLSDEAILRFANDAPSGRVSVEARTPTAESDTADHARFSERLSALKAAGRTRDEASAILTREGWDVMTGLRKR